MANSSLSALKRHLKAGKRVDPTTGCWLWQGWINNEGYGRVQWGKKKYLAHRLSAVAFKGYKLEDYDKGLQVNHLCHVRACINPEHFYIGTQEDNMVDLDDKLAGKSYIRKMVLAVFTPDAAGEGEIQLTYEIYSPESDSIPQLTLPTGSVSLGEWIIDIPPVKE